MRVQLVGFHEWGSLAGRVWARPPALTFGQTTRWLKQLMMLCSRVRYCNSPLGPRPGAEKTSHDTYLHRAITPQSRPAVFKRKKKLELCVCVCVCVCVSDDVAGCWSSWRRRIRERAGRRRCSPSSTAARTGPSTRCTGCSHARRGFMSGCTYACRRSPSCTRARSALAPGETGR
jgi:hypothetical protein